jgi:hypothetical protein
LGDSETFDFTAEFAEPAHDRARVQRVSRDARLKFLEIKFDRQHVVRAYNWSGDKK